MRKKIGRMWGELNRVEGEVEKIQITDSCVIFKKIKIKFKKLR